MISCVAMVASAGVLNGEEKSFVVIGYSTSFQWPDILQNMLDEHAGGPGVYKVHNASVGSSPVATWLGKLAAEDREKTFGKMAQDFFVPGEGLAGGVKPSVALLQQSLQWIYAERDAGIRSAEDAERIEQGADAFFELAEQVHGLGVETVYLATHIYKAPMEPEIGNERFALDALLERGSPFIRRGPELWGPTKKEYPEAYAKDKLHPNVIGARMMAVGWYRILAGEDAKGFVIFMAEGGYADKLGVRLERPPRAVLPFAQRDMDGDGFLTANEYPGYMLRLFERIDTDEDERISPTEYDVYSGKLPGEEE